jgi:hypothetical protein
MPHQLQTDTTPPPVETDAALTTSTDRQRTIPSTDKHCTSTSTDNHRTATSTDRHNHVYKETPHQTTDTVNMNKIKTDVTPTTNRHFDVQTGRVRHHIEQTTMQHTLMKKKKKILTYKEIYMGSGAKSYMRKGFLIYKEMRKYLTIYEEAVSYIWLCTRSHLNFLMVRNFFFLLFYQCSNHFS